jgi:hypothetical protein
MPKTKPFKINVGLDIKGDWQSRPLDFLVELNKCTETLVENLTRQAVSLARQQGHTWEEIGESLGVSRQAAWERFAPGD